MTISYVTPPDMEVFYEHSDLVEATNLRDSSAEQINLVKLEAVCDGANGIAYGYLVARYADERIQINQLPQGLVQTFRVHCAAIAWHLLDGSSEEARNKQQDAIDYFQWFSKEDRLAGGSIPGAGGTTASISYETGRQMWTSGRYDTLFGS